jgi:hypothetical protein
MTTKEEILEVVRKFGRPPSEQSTARYVVRCGFCDMPFGVSKLTAKYCSDRCRQRACRAGDNLAVERAAEIARREAALAEPPTIFDGMAMGEEKPLVRRA